MLLIYPVGKPTENNRETVLDQWADDLAPFNAGTVKRACDKWRQTHERRPMPSQIVDLCRDMTRPPSRTETQAALRPKFDHAKFDPWDNPDTLRQDWRSFPVHEMTRAEKRLSHEEYLADCAARGAQCTSDARVGFVDGAYLSTEGANAR